MTATLNPDTNRLTIETVQNMERLIGGDPVTEQLILNFIEKKWKVPDLMRLPVKVAQNILNRPTDFIAAAKRFESQPF